MVEVQEVEEVELNLIRRPVIGSNEEVVFRFVSIFQGIFFQTMSIIEMFWFVIYQ